MTKQGKQSDGVDLSARLQAVLFVTGDAVTERKLAKVLGISVDELSEVIGQLADRLKSGGALGLVRHDDKVQMVTAPEQMEFIESMIVDDTSEDLSRATLEVLAIVAYREPIARVDIDAIRGVNCAGHLRKLMVRGLAVRKPHPTDSRSYVYHVTNDFLSYLGLENITQLPDFDKLRSSDKITQIIHN